MEKKGLVGGFEEFHVMERRGPIFIKGVDSKNLELPKGAVKELIQAAEGSFATVRGESSAIEE